MPAYVRGPRGPLRRVGRRAPPVQGGEWASERPGAPRRLLPAPHRAPAPPGPRGSASPRLRSSRPCWGPEGSREKHSLSSRDVTRRLARCVSPRYRRQPTERVRGGPDKGRGQTGSGAPGRPAPSRLCAPALCMLRAGGRGPPPSPAVLVTRLWTWHCHASSSRWQTLPPVVCPGPSAELVAHGGGADHALRGPGYGALPFVGNCSWTGPP